MNDVLPERAWFEKTKVARQLLRDKNPENPKILSIQIQTSVGLKYNQYGSF